MLALAALVFVVVLGGVYLLVNMLTMGVPQKRFCMTTTAIALFLGLMFGEYAQEAMIAILVFGMGGLLILDRR